MARVKVKVPELMGATQVAELLGVKTGNLYKIKGLPQPIPAPPAPTVGGKLWLGDEVREFAAQRTAENQRAAPIAA